MRAFLANKLLVSLLAVLALGALTQLAIGMKSMSFREAQAFGQDEAVAARVNPADLIRTVLDVPLSTQLILWGLVALMFVLIAMLLSPETRKRLLQLLFRVAVIYWGLYFLFTRYPEVLERLGLVFSPRGFGTPALGETTPPPVFTPPSSTSWMTYLISFVVIVAAVFVARKVYSVWRELNEPTSSDLPQKLAGIARTSLRDLTSGRDSTDVIMNCYFRMSDVVAEKKNLDRRASMTPHEFALRLEQAGLPGDAVKRLTRLFEAVRYGQRRSDPKTVNEAVACLTTILQYCGEPV